MALTAYRPTPELVRLVDRLDGRWTGYRALCRCPAHVDRTPSLSIRQGDRGIFVKCFAGCDPSDILRELARIERVPQHGPVDSCDFERRPDANVARLWSEGTGVSNTLAARYLALRRIDDRFAGLRYHPRCPKGPKPTTVYKPALMVAAFNDDELRAIQRIFLDAAGRATEKLMIGRPEGSAWRGSAPVNGCLAIAEGFESAARFTMRTGIPCWAALGAARLPLLDLSATLSELIVAEDDDAEGRAAGRRAAQAYARSGLTIRHMPPPRPNGRTGPNDWARLA